MPLPHSDAVKRIITFLYALKKYCCAINMCLCKLSSITPALASGASRVSTAALQSFGGSGQAGDLNTAQPLAAKAIVLSSPSLIIQSVVCF